MKNIDCGYNQVTILRYQEQLDFRMWGAFGHLGTSSFTSLKLAIWWHHFKSKSCSKRYTLVLWRMWLSHSTLFAEIIVIKCHNDIKLFHRIGEYLQQQGLLTERGFIGLKGHKQNLMKVKSFRHKEGVQESVLTLIYAISTSLAFLPFVFPFSALKPQTSHYDTITRFGWARNCKIDSAYEKCPGPTKEILIPGFLDDMHKSAF